MTHSLVLNNNVRYIRLRTCIQWYCLLQHGKKIYTKSVFALCLVYTYVLVYIYMCCTHTETATELSIPYAATVKIAVSSGFATADASLRSWQRLWGRSLQRRDKRLLFLERRAFGLRLQIMADFIFFKLSATTVSIIHRLSENIHRVFA